MNREDEILKRLTDMEQRYEDIILELGAIGDCLKKQYLDRAVCWKQISGC